MNTIKSFVFTLFAASTSFGLSAAVGDIIEDRAGIKYKILSEPDGNEPGTCEVTDNRDFEKSTQINFPYSVSDGDKEYVLTRIGDYAFGSPEGNGITAAANKIMSVSFNDCTALESVGDYAFYHAQRLDGISITNDIELKSIGKYAFSYCNKFNKFNFSHCPDLQLIDEYAFRGTALTTLDLTACLSLEEIGANAFAGGGFVDVNLSGLPALRYIRNNAFYSCSKLVSVDFSDCAALEIIGYEAFDSDHAIETIHFDGCSKLKNIEYNAFYWTYVETVDLSSCSSLEFIGNSAFSDCNKLKYVLLPESIKTLDYSAFLRSPIEYLVCNAVEIPVAYSNCFSTAFSNSGRIYVPGCAVEAYKNNEVWSKFAAQILPIGWVNSITVQSDNNNTGNSLYIDQQITLNVSYSPDDAPVPALIWKVEGDQDAVLLDVDSQNGLSATVKAVKAGNATINAIVDLGDCYDDKPFVTYPVTVLGEENKLLTLSKNTLTLDGLTTDTLIAAFFPSSVKTQLEWSVDNDKILNVTPGDSPEIGVITSLAAGNAVVTVKDVVSGLSASCKVTVNKVEMYNFYLYPASYFIDCDINEGALSLYIEIDPENVTEIPEFVWSVDNPDVGTVRTTGPLSAEFTPLQPGICLLNVYPTNIPNYNLSKQITVMLSPDDYQLTVSPSAIDLKVGDSRTLSAEISPLNFQPFFFWNVDDPSVIELVPSATPDNSEISILAKKPGKALITLSEFYSELKAYCEVIVVDMKLNGLKLIVEKSSVDLQDSPIALLVETDPYDFEMPPLHWISSDETVATVAAASERHALLTPLAAGKLTVTVAHAGDHTINDSAEITVTDKSSLNDVLDDAYFDGPVDVYDLNGRLLKKQADIESLLDLSPGIYIFRNGTTAKKILIR